MGVPLPHGRRPALPRRERGRGAATGPGGRRRADGAAPHALARRLRRRRGGERRLVAVPRHRPRGEGRRGGGDVRGAGGRAARRRRGGALARRDRASRAGPRHVSGVRRTAWGAPLRAAHRRPAGGGREAEDLCARPDRPPRHERVNERTPARPGARSGGGAARDGAGRGPDRADLLRAPARALAPRAGGRDRDEPRGGAPLAPGAADRRGRHGRCARRCARWMGRRSGR